MKREWILTLIATLAIVAGSAHGASTDDELWIIAAGRGPGAEGSFWVTDLWLMAPGEDALEVDVTFLDQAADNTEAEPLRVTIQAGQTLVLRDVVSTLFGKESGFGALHVEVVEEEEDGEGEDDDRSDLLEDDAELIAHAQIYDSSETGTVGLALPGFASEAAVSADGPTTTHLVGIRNDALFRTNWFGVNVGDDDEEAMGPAVVLVEILGEDGEIVAAGEYTIPPAGMVLIPAAGLAPSIEKGTIRFTMLSGSAIFGGSRVDNRTNDSSGLEATSRPVGRGRDEFTDEFFIETCTFSTTGGNPFFPLHPGLRLTLEGEEDGEIEQVIIEVLNETFVVDGVTTRVVTETESVDGELEEISRNYFAECIETGDVFYFGEHVDIYEDGEIVSSEGEWLAGEDGARAGIIMPGSPLAGSRYYQEVAPGVALDRAEHIATNISFETEAGAFERCIVVEDSSPLEPGARDRKVYCPGFGNVYDDGLELVSFVNAPAP